MIEAELSLKRCSLQSSCTGVPLGRTPPVRHVLIPTYAADTFLLPDDGRLLLRGPQAGHEARARLTTLLARADLRFPCKHFYPGLSSAVARFWRLAMDCPICGAGPGRMHRKGCGWEQCPYCGGHAIGCPCGRRGILLDDRIPWAGYCPWQAACRQFGFFERNAIDGWVPCRADQLGSLPDLPRLLRLCPWNRAEKRFKRRREAA
jgi:hypothetical protein